MGYGCWTLAAKATGSSRNAQCAKLATSAWETTPAGPSGSVKAREHEDRELPAGLVLILDKNRYLCGLAVEQALGLLLWFPITYIC